MGTAEGTTHHWLGRADSTSCHLHRSCGQARMHSNSCRNASQFAVREVWRNFDAPRRPCWGCPGPCDAKGISNWDCLNRRSCTPTVPFLKATVLSRALLVLAQGHDQCFRAQEAFGQDLCAALCEHRMAAQASVCLRVCLFSRVVLKRIYHY